MSRKRKQAELQQRLDNRLAEEQRIAAAIAEAEKIAEPGEKLMKLEELMGDINDVVNKEKSTITYKGVSARENVALGGVGSCFAIFAGGVAAATIAPPVGAGMMLAALSTLAASIPVSDKRENIVKKKFEAEAKDHFHKIEDLKQAVLDLKETTIAFIKDHKLESLESPYYSQFSKLPELSEEFDGAAMVEAYKKEAEAKTTAVEPAKPREPWKPSATVVRSPLRSRRL